MRKHAFFDNLIGRHLAETLYRCNGMREGAGSSLNWKHLERRGANVEINGTLSGTESTLFRIFPHISVYFHVAGNKKLGGRSVAGRTASAAALLWRDKLCR